MEVLETARVDAFCANDIVVSASRRRDVLCVVWEGACVEREQERNGMTLIPKEKMRRVQNAKAREAKRRFVGVREVASQVKTGAVWYAGDWTGPRSLQPEKRLSGESSLSRTHDIVAKSSEGVKVNFPFFYLLLFQERNHYSNSVVLFLLFLTGYNH